MADGNQIQTTMTMDQAQFMREMAKQVTVIAKSARAFVEMKEAAKSVGPEAQSAFSAGVDGARDLAMNLTGVTGAVSVLLKGLQLVKAEWQNIKEVQDASRAALAAPAVEARKLKFNFNPDQTMGIEDIEPTAMEIANRTETPVEQILSAWQNASSGKGSLTNAQAVPFVESAFRMYPADSESAKPITDAALDLAKIQQSRGKTLDPDAVMGWLGRVQVAMRTTSMADTAKVVSPVTAAGQSSGDTPQYLATFLSALTQRMGAGSHEQAATSLGGFLQRLQKFESESDPSRVQRMSGYVHDVMGTIDLPGKHDAKKKLEIKERLGLITEQNSKDPEAFAAAVQGLIDDVKKTVGQQSIYAKRLTTASERIQKARTTLVDKNEHGNEIELPVAAVEKFRAAKSTDERKKTIQEFPVLLEALMPELKSKMNVLARPHIEAFLFDKPEMMAEVKAAAAQIPDITPELAQEHQQKIAVVNRGRFEPVESARRQQAVTKQRAELATTFDQRESQARQSLEEGLKTAGVPDWKQTLIGMAQSLDKATSIGPFNSPELPERFAIAAATLELQSIEKQLRNSPAPARRQKLESGQKVLEALIRTLKAQAALYDYRGDVIPAKPINLKPEKPKPAAPVQTSAVEAAKTLDEPHVMGAGPFAPLVAMSAMSVTPEGDGVDRENVQAETTGGIENASPAGREKTKPIEVRQAYPVQTSAVEVSRPVEQSHVVGAGRFAPLVAMAAMSATPEGISTEAVAKPTQVEQPQTQPHVIGGGRFAPLVAMAAMSATPEANDAELVMSRPESPKGVGEVVQAWPQMRDASATIRSEGAEQRYKEAVVEQLMSVADGRNQWTREGIEKTHRENFGGDTKAFAEYARNMLVMEAEQRRDSETVTQEYEPGQRTPQRDFTNVGFGRSIAESLGIVKPTMKRPALPQPTAEIDPTGDAMRLAANNIGEMKPEQFERTPYQEGIHQSLTQAERLSRPVMTPQPMPSERHQSILESIEQAGQIMRGEPVAAVTPTPSDSVPRVAASDQAKERHKQVISEELMRASDSEGLGLTPAGIEQTYQQFGGNDAEFRRYASQTLMSRADDRTGPAAERLARSASNISGLRPEHFERTPVAVAEASRLSVPADVAEASRLSLPDVPTAAIADQPADQPAVVGVASEGLRRDAPATKPAAPMSDKVAETWARVSAAKTNAVPAAPRHFDSPKPVMSERAQAAMRRVAERNPFTDKPVMSERAQAATAAVERRKQAPQEQTDVSRYSAAMGDEEQARSGGQLQPTINVQGGDTKPVVGEIKTSNTLLQSVVDELKSLASVMGGMQSGGGQSQSRGGRERASVRPGSALARN
jgi:hypothetical protein